MMGDSVGCITNHVQYGDMIYFFSFERLDKDFYFKLQSHTIDEANIEAPKPAVDES